MPPPQLPRRATYTPTIVWGTGTGISTAQYDDVSQYYLADPGLVVDGIGRDQARAYAPPSVPAFDLTLDNWSGRFSPGGPIGSFVGRGSATTLDVRYGIDQLANAADISAMDDQVMANGIQVARLFDGVTNTAQQILTRPQRAVQMRALGRLALLLDKRPLGGRLYENIRTDEAIAVLLDAIGWPAGTRVLDTGDTRLTYWWMDGTQTGMEVLNLILGAEGAGGCAYAQGGIFHFEGRQSRMTNVRSTEAQWIFSDGLTSDVGANAALTLANDDRTLANGEADVLLFDVNPSEYFSNPDEVVSGTTTTIKQRSPTSGVVKVWELGRPLVIDPLDTVEIDALIDTPYRGALVPQEGLDYSLEVGSAPVTVTLLQTSGVHVRTRWTAGGTPTTINGGSGGSNGPQVRAVSLPVVSEIVVPSTVNTSQFAGRYASKEYQHTMWPEVLRTQALDIVNSMTQRYMQERRQATIRVANLDGKHMAAILNIRISDRVTWMQAHGAINDPYWVEQISHEIAPGGGLHIMTLGLERAYSLVGSRFDAAWFNPDAHQSVFAE